MSRHRHIHAHIHMAIQHTFLGLSTCTNASIYAEYVLFLKKILFCQKKKVLLFAMFCNTLHFKEENYQSIGQHPYSVKVPCSKLVPDTEYSEQGNSCVLSLYPTVPGWYLQPFDDRFLQHSFQFSIHSSLKYLMPPNLSSCQYL